MLHEVFIADCLTPKCRSTLPFGQLCLPLGYVQRGFAHSQDQWQFETLLSGSLEHWVRSWEQCGFIKSRNFVGKVDYIVKNKNKKNFLLNTELTVKMLHEVFTADCVSPKFRSTLLFWTTLIWRGTKLKTHVGLKMWKMCKHFHLHASFVSK